MRNKNIPYGRQYIDRQDIDNVVKVLQGDWITQGPKIEEFEKTLCKYTGAKYAVAVSSGTAALHIAALTAGIEEGDEVITSPITFVASANCVLYCGGKPVFADIEKDTGNINPKEIRKKLTYKTKAIIPVHYAGHPCDMEEIRQIANEHNLIIIEDACHALGSEYKGEKAGSCKYSDMTVFSFHPVKHITTGEGGAVLTNNKDYYEKLLLLRNHGITRNPGYFTDDNSHLQEAGSWYYEQQHLGYNYRITDFQCALGISQMNKLEGFVRRRREIVDLYKTGLNDNEFFNLPVERDYLKSSWHIYPVKLKQSYVDQKKAIIYYLKEKGLGVQVHYIPVHWQPYYKKLGYEKNACSFAGEFYSRVMSIPIFPSMSDDDVNYVVKTIRNANF